MCGPSPLGPVRDDYQVHFLHWTPDGSQLIFGHAEKIWKADLFTGALVEIVDVNPVEEGSSKGRGMAFSFYASPAPDGSQIVYSTCQYQAADTPLSYFVGATTRTKLRYEIAAIGIDGTEQRRLTKNFFLESYPVWSPDGKKLAYSYVLGGRLDIADVDELGDLKLTNSVATRNVSQHPTVWSPDSQRLAFSTREKVGRTFRRVIHTVRADGSEMQRIGVTTTLPTWSPDGKRLAFAWSDDEFASIFTIRYDGTDLLEIYDSKRDGKHRNISDVAWSPDGSEILVVSRGPGSKIRSGYDKPYWTHQLWTITPDGNENRSLISSEYILRFRDSVWSPDGSRIAAVAWDHRETREDFKVVTLAPDGTDLRVLVAARPPVEDRDDYPVDIYSVNPLRPREPADAAACSAGIVVPDPQNNPGLVHDCKVLLEMRDSLAGRAILNWSPNLSILEWEGVEVEGIRPLVSVLDLSDRGITGTIPPEMAQLTGLTRLILASEYGFPTPNILTGPIPPELGDLSKLEWLSLAGNFLSGSIPESLSALEHLRFLGVGHNFLSGCIPDGTGASQF